MKGRRAGGADAAAALARLRAEEPRRLYLLHGEDAFLVERAVAILRERSAATEEWRVVWGDDDPERLDDAFAAMAARGLFGGPATVLVRHVEMLRGAGEAALERVLEEDRYAGRLVLAGGPVDRRRRWVALAAARAHECVCTPPADARAAQPWVERLAAERGVRLAPAATGELLERCGPDLALLDCEIEKLALRAGAGAVDRDAVQRGVPAVRGHAIEELTDRLGRGDRAGAVRVLRALLAAGEAPLRVVGFLAANVRRALHVVEQSERGLAPDAVAAVTGMPEWLVRKQLARGPAARLERALAVLAQLDLQLKRSRPEEAVFEAALAALGGRSAR